MQLRTARYATMVAASALAASCGGSARPSPRRLLTADGIGHARFGMPAQIVLADLTRLYGAPEIPRGQMGSCTQAGWAGRAFTSPTVSTSTSTTLSVELRVFFRHSAFSGYAYYWSVPFLQIRRGHQPSLTLSTERGLTLGTSPNNARRLYGPAFSVGRAVMGAGVPWTVTTPSGRIYGEMTIPDPRFHQIIQTINAGISIQTGCS